MLLHSVYGVGSLATGPVFTGLNSDYLTRKTPPSIFESAPIRHIKNTEIDSLLHRPVGVDVAEYLLFYLEGGEELLLVYPLLDQLCYRGVGSQRQLGGLKFNRYKINLNQLFFE